MSRLLLLIFMGTSVIAEAGPSVSNGPDSTLTYAVTPVGAIRAGNGADIPEWTGGLRKRPVGYEKGGPLVIPRAIKYDRALATITAANVDQFSDALSAGHKHLLRTHATYRLPVYASRRTAAYPKSVYLWTKNNARRASLAGASKIAGAIVGFPFPLPRSVKSGRNIAAKVMWNHKLRFRGSAMDRTNDLAVVAPSGKIKLTKLKERIQFFYGDDWAGRRYAIDSKTNLVFKAETQFDGQYVVLSKGLIKPQQTPLKSLVVRDDAPMMLAVTPDFDTPLPGSGGLQFADQADMYNGSMARYRWQLLGVKEMYIPYNAYKGADRSLKYADIMTPKHYNQALARYEKHRVWVINATLRKGKTHAFSRRVFYVNEDCWCVAMVDNYDASGQLYRFQEAHLMQQYDVLTMISAPALIYDFKTGTYFGAGLANEGAPTRYRRKVNLSYHAPGRGGQQVSW